VGARDLDPAEARFIAQSGIRTYPVETLASAENLCRAIEATGLRHLYVHFDVDVIDPNDFPDALMHAPGGPSLGDLAACLRRLTDCFEVVGTSVVEFRGESADSRKLLTDMLRSAGLAG
jgi:arginase